MAELEGYIIDGKLVDGDGRPLGWDVYSDRVQTYRNPDTGEKSSAVILVKRWDTHSSLGQRAMLAGGYWLGPDAGDLFRGETLPRQFSPGTRQGDAEIDDAADEAADLAQNESEGWIKRDQEAEEEARAEAEAPGEYPEHFHEPDGGWGPTHGWSPLLSGQFVEGETFRDALERGVYYQADRDRRGRVNGALAVALPGAPADELTPLSGLTDDELRQLLPIRLRSSFTDRRRPRRRY